jgi:hypothetical protein
MADVSDLGESVTRFMAAAMRRLWWLQALRRLQLAALVSLLAAALAAGTHTLLVALPAWPALLAVLTPILLAGLAALAARPTAQQAAWWADRNLAGAALFSTWQDFLLARDGPASARARLGLQTRTAAALQHSSAQLAALRVPGQWRLFWLIVSCALLCSLVALSDGRQQQPAVAANAAAAGETPADAAPTAATARDELRRALLTEARNPAAKNAAADAPTNTAPPQDEPDSPLARSRAARNAAASAGDGAASGGLGAGTGRGGAPLQAATSTPAPQLTARFRRIDGTLPTGFDGADAGNGFATTFGTLSADDRDFDSRQAQLARRVAPADVAARQTLRGLSLPAVELMRRYAASQESSR